MMAGARPPLGTVIQIDGSHQIFDGKNFVPATQGADGGWAVDPAAQARMGVGATGASQKLTEDQAKSQTYARLMRHAESSYQRALDEGYDPGSIKNAFASLLEGLPFGGLDGAAAYVRDDKGDRARQAELEWSDAQLKAVSGAASPEAEVKRNVRTYFPQAGEHLSDIRGQKDQARHTAFDSAKIRAGPAGEAVGTYNAGAKEHPDVGWDKLPAPQLATARRYSGAVGRPGTARNPFVPGDDGEYNALPSKSYFVAPDGSLRMKP